MATLLSTLQNIKPSRWQPLKISWGGWQLMPKKAPEKVPKKSHRLFHWQILLAKDPSRFCWSSARIGYHLSRIPTHLNVEHSDSATSKGFPAQKKLSETRWLFGSLRQSAPIKAIMLWYQHTWPAVKRKNTPARKTKSCSTRWIPFEFQWLECVASEKEWVNKKTRLQRLLLDIDSIYRYP